MSDAPAETSVSITIDGKQIDARPGELVIDAAERTGTYIPRFCYHHRMDPVGMCRMCLVDIDSGRGPALQPSCMVTVTPDMFEPAVAAGMTVLARCGPPGLPARALYSSGTDFA